MARRATPKITDFGLAKRLDDLLGQTQTGDMLGTPSYMAPEQAGGQIRDIGPATDVWALGVILYECLTGRQPFEAPSLLETIERIRGEGPVPPRLLRPSLPADLETVTLKCLEKDRSLTSIGAGVIFRLFNRANLEVTYAHPLHAANPGGPRPGDRVLVQLTASLL